MKESFRFLVRTAVAAAVCTVVFFLRKRAVCSLFALSDAFSVGGFLVLAASIFPRIARWESFDGFVYAAGCALAGLFPKLMVDYRRFKLERRERSVEKDEDLKKIGRNRRFAAWQGGVLLSVGLLIAILMV
jgi:hypothetical protein